MSRLIKDTEINKNIQNIVFKFVCYKFFPNKVRQVQWAGQPLSYFSLGTHRVSRTLTQAVLLGLAWEHLENFPKIGPGWM